MYILYIQELLLLLCRPVEFVTAKRHAIGLMLRIMLKIFISQSYLLQSCKKN